MTSRYQHRGIDELRQEASGAKADHPDVEAIAEPWAEAEVLREELADLDVAGYVTERYREWYQDWLDDEEDEDAPCSCTNPRCPLKRGRLPYALRRPEPVLRAGARRDDEQRIRDWLRSHAEATAIAEALTEVAQKRQQMEALYQEVTEQEQLLADAADQQESSS